MPTRISRTYQLSINTSVIISNISVIIVRSYSLFLAVTVIIFGDPLRPSSTSTSMASFIDSKKWFPVPRLPYARCTSLFCHIIIIIIQDARHYSATLLLLLFKMHVNILPQQPWCTSLFCHSSPVTQSPFHLSPQCLPLPLDPSPNACPPWIAWIEYGTTKCALPSTFVQYLRVF